MAAILKFKIEALYVNGHWHQESTQIFALFTQAHRLYSHCLTNQIVIRIIIIPVLLINHYHMVAIVRALF